MTALQQMEGGPLLQSLPLARKRHISDRPKHVQRCHHRQHDGLPRNQAHFPHHIVYQDRANMHWPTSMARRARRRRGALSSQGGLKVKIC